MPPKFKENLCATALLHNLGNLYFINFLRNVLTKKRRKEVRKYLIQKSFGILNASLILSLLQLSIYFGYD